MDVLTGLTLDNTSLPTGTVVSGDLEQGAVFEKVLGDEIQQLQLDESAAAAADQLLMYAELTAEMTSSDDIDSNEQSVKDATLTEVGVLLTGQQQVIKTDVMPAAVATEYWLREADTTIRHTSETATSALASITWVQENSGQSDIDAGNSLPQRKAIELSSLPGKMNSASTKSIVEEALPETGEPETTPATANTQSIQAATKSTASIEVDPLDNVDTTSIEPATTRIKSSKHDATVASALQQASTPTVANFVPKNAMPPMPVGPTPTAPSTFNPITTSPSFKADMAVVARVGDLGKWSANNEVACDAGAADSGLGVASTTQEIRSSETSIPAGLRLPFFNPRFNDVVSNQVLWMSKQGINQADIHLNPAELGPITVRLQQNGQETSVQFVVAHPATKDQLEQALPRLRDVFQHGGLQLINVDIQDGRKQPQHDQAPATSSPNRSTSANHTAVAASLAAPLTAQPEGLIDFYA